MTGIHFQMKVGSKDINCTNILALMNIWFDEIIEASLLHIGK
jgi:hypothetical protein